MLSESELSRLAIDLVAAGAHFARAAYQTSGVEVSYVSLRVLAALEREPGLRVGELATREGIMQPSMSQAIKKLVDDGLVTRNPAPDDARATNLTITEAGRQAVSAYRAGVAEKIGPVFRELSAGEVETLAEAARLLPQLTQRLRDA